MIETYPNAWDFGNSDKKLTSTFKDFKIEYGILTEIAMGAPLGGQCFLVTEKGDKFCLNKWCGGPPIWDKSGKQVAIPIWKRTFLKGTIQKIIVLNIETGELIKFKKQFNVLDLRTFDNGIISGYDNPKYKPKMIQFDLRIERIEEKTNITKINNRC
jgi:hypothetical protein